MNKRIGKATLQFEKPVYIHSYGTVVGPQEKAGPLGEKFDYDFPNNLYNEDSWEKAEQKMQRYAMEIALEKGGKLSSDLDCYIGGDLLNQIIASSFNARTMQVPYLGLYGACSTLAESLVVGSCLIDGGFAQRIGVCTSSHHDTAERQLRYPTEMGVQRPLTAQWTVTGSGAYILDENSPSGIVIKKGIIGKIIDLGIADNNDMGTAMAPAAIDTIATFLEDNPNLTDIDLVVTGDLGYIGQELCFQGLLNKGHDLKGKYLDCGALIYTKSQDVHAGGSGCGCSATVLGAHFLPMLQSKQVKKILLVGTGALLSPASVQQGETIPCIAHGVLIEAV